MPSIDEGEEGSAERRASSHCEGTRTPRRLPRQETSFFLRRTKLFMSHPYTRRGRTPSPSQLYSSWNSHHQQHWGRRTWDSLFLLASDFPHRRQCDDDAEFSRTEVSRKRRAWKSLLESLPNVLSCPVCGRHFREYMHRHPLSHALQNRETLLRWLYRAKDEVNRRTHRTSISYKRVRRRYVPSCTRRSGRGSRKRKSRPKR